MWTLAIPGVGLLSLFVFACGFIPIAGVIISTVPVGFVALTEYGFTKVRACWRVGRGEFACACAWLAAWLAGWLAGVARLASRSASRSPSPSLLHTPPLLFLCSSRSSSS